MQMAHAFIIIMLYTHVLNQGGHYTFCFACRVPCFSSASVSGHCATDYGGNDLCEEKQNTDALTLACTRVHVYM